MENNKSKDRIPSIINSQKTPSLHSESKLTSDDRTGGIAVKAVDDADFDGDDRQHTTALDRIEVESVIGDPK